MSVGTPYYSQSRREILPFVPKSVKSALDVGCGEGLFGELLKNELNAEVWGVEMVPSAAEQAKKRLDRVFSGTLEGVYPQLPQGHFDCVVLNDVLEHMVEPQAALQLATSLLTDGGVFVCSIPNVRFLPNLLELLVQKDWRYRESGVLDRTHLRFFTQKSIVRMFEDAGSETLTIAGVNGIRSLKKRLLFWILTVVTLGSTRDTYNQQFVCVARPK